jgi:hypothetical protein
MSEALHKAILKIPEESWEAYGEAHAREIRECAEVSFVPGEKTEHKDTQPLRYVAIRIRQKQETLFEDGSKVKHFAVVTNIGEWKAGRLIQWHREKAGTVEHTHDEVNNDLGGGQMPSQRFGVNGAWFKLALLAYNLVSAIKGLCLEGEERTARLKKFRLLMIHLPGRMNRNNCVMGLRLCGQIKAVQRMQRVWDVFALPTQATSTQARGGRGG